MNIEQVYTIIALVGYISIISALGYLWFIRESNLRWCIDNTEITEITEDWTSGIGEYFWTQGNRIVQYIGIVNSCPTFKVIPSILGCTTGDYRNYEEFNTVQLDEDAPVQYNAMGWAHGNGCNIQDKVTDEEFEYFVLRGE